MFESEKSPFKSSKNVAPYNGFGTIDDSMGSCKNLVLKGMVIIIESTKKKFFKTFGDG